MIGGDSNGDRSLQGGKSHTRVLFSRSALLSTELVTAVLALPAVTPRLSV